MRRDRNPEPGRNSLLFTNGSKGSFSCRTIDSPSNITHLYRDQAYPLGDPGKTLNLPPRSPKSTQLKRTIPVIINKICQTLADRYTQFSLATHPLTLIPGSPMSNQLKRISSVTMAINMYKSCQKVTKNSWIQDIYDLYI